MIDTVKMKKWKVYISKSGSHLRTPSAWLSVLILVGLIVITSQYCDLTDYRVYYREYNSIMQTGEIGLTHDFEVGYTAIEFLMARMGIPFRVFYASYMAIFLYLIYKFYATHLNNPLYALVLFVVFPYINCVQQIRSALAAAIMLQAVDGLLLKKKRGKRNFILAVALSATLHITNVIFLLFIPILGIAEKKLEKLLVILFVVVPFGASGIYQVLYAVLSAIPVFDRIMHNVGKTLYISRFTTLTFLLFAILLALLIFVKHCGLQDEISLGLYKLALLSIGFIFFMILSANAYRVSIMLLPIIYTAVLRMAQQQNARNRVFFKVSLLIFACTIFILFWGPANPDMYYILTKVMWKMSPIN